MKSMILKRLPVFLCLVFSVGGCASSGYNKHANDFYEQGLVWFEQKEYQRASESFTKVLEMAPYGKENYKVHYNRGMAYLRNRQYEKAIRIKTPFIIHTDRGAIPGRTKGNTGKPLMIMIRRSRCSPAAKTPGTFTWGGLGPH